MAKWSINELRNRSGTSNKRRSVALGATGALVGAIVAPASDTRAAGTPGGQLIYFIGGVVSTLGM